MKLDINLNNTNIVVLLVYVIFMLVLLCSSLDKELIVHILLIMVLSVFAIYLYKKNIVDNFIENNNSLDRELGRFEKILAHDLLEETEKKNNKSNEKPLVEPHNPSPEMGAKLDSTIGDYDQIVIDAGKHQNRRVLIPGFTDNMVSGDTDCGNLSAPCNVPLYENPIHVNPDGLEVPYDTDTAGMPLNDVIGHSSQDQNMFLFSHNKCSPACCPSSYSCDNGCVCTTKEQRDLLARGGRN